MGRHCSGDLKTRVYDTVVIGAGPGGYYICSELEKKGYKGALCVIEKNHFPGGRLYSEETWEKTRDSVKDELGGMRIFPSVHKEVYKMAQDSGLDVIPVPLTDSNSLFNFDGKTYRKQDVRIPGTGKFANEKVSSIAKAAKAKFKESHGHVKDAYKSPQLQNLSIREFFKKYGGANDEEIDFWFAYSGYNLYGDDIQVAIYVADGELYGSNLSHHHFVQQGYARLVEKIGNTVNCPCRYSLEVERICRRDVDGMYVLRCKGYPKVLAKNVIFSVTKPQLLQIENITNCLSPRRLAAIDCCIPMPLFKAFLEFNDPWWIKAGFAGQGKSTTDKNCRQIHYYDESDLLIYNSGQYAEYWGKIFENDPMKGYRMMFEEVKEIHQPYCKDEIPEPDWEQCSHKFWSDGSHKWKKGCDARECIEIIADGSKDGLYITGDAFSDQQGWVQGAWDTSKIVLNHFLEAEKHHVKEKAGKSKNSDHTEISIMELEVEESEPVSFPCSCCCRKSY